MESPFAYDWENEKRRLLRRHYRDVAVCVGVALPLLPPAYVLTHSTDNETAMAGILVYAMSIGALVMAAVFYRNSLNFAKDWYRQASSGEYRELLELSSEYPKTGPLCRAAVVRLISLQGHITTWQARWFKGDLREYGDREKVEELKEVFVRRSQENGPFPAKTV